MFRLQVLFNGNWKWGLNSYNSYDQATLRLEKLKKVGIKARVRPESELYN